MVLVNPVFMTNMETVLPVLQWDDTRGAGIDNGYHPHDDQSVGHLISPINNWHTRSWGSKLDCNLKAKRPSYSITCKNAKGRGLQLIMPSDPDSHAWQISQRDLPFRPLGRARVVNRCCRPGRSPRFDSPLPDVKPPFL